MGDFIGGHGGIPDDDHFPVMRVFVHDIHGRHGLGPAPQIGAPQALIRAVVEVEIFQVFEGRARGREELLAHLHVRIHGAADVKQGEHLDGIAPFRTHDDIQPALFGGGADRIVQVQLFMGAVAGKLAQAAQGDLEIACAQLAVAVQVLVAALFPDLHRLLVAALPADANAGGIVSGMSEGRGAARADPFIAALMPLGLLLEALLQRLHELVEGHFLERGHFLFGELALHHGFQPVRRDFLFAEELGQRFHTLEDMGKDHVELVEILLVLHQRGAADRVEMPDLRFDHALVERFEQGEVFPRGNGNAGGAKFGEEVMQHDAAKIACVGLVSMGGMTRTVPFSRDGTRLGGPILLFVK